MDAQMEGGRDRRRDWVDRRRDGRMDDIGVCIVLTCIVVS